MQSDAERLGFEVVLSAIDASADYEEQHKKVVDTAEQAVLQYKGRDIYLTELNVADQFLMGKVTEIAHVCAMAYEGVKLGQILTFSYIHIQQTIKPA